MGKEKDVTFRRVQIFEQDVVCCKAETKFTVLRAEVKRRSLLNNV